MFLRNYEKLVPIFLLVVTYLLWLRFTAFQMHQISDQIELFDRTDHMPRSLKHFNYLYANKSKLTKNKLFSVKDKKYLWSIELNKVNYQFWYFLIKTFFVRNISFTLKIWIWKSHLWSNGKTCSKNFDFRINKVQVIGKEDEIQEKI